MDPIPKTYATASSAQGWWVGKDGKRYKGTLYVDHSKGEATILTPQGRQIEAA